MANILKIKRGLESARSGITPAEGEFLYTTDEKKLYIGDGTTAGGNLVTSGASSVSDNVFAMEAAVDLTSVGTQTMGTLPANADVLRTTFVVGTASDAVTTVTFGDPSNGAASYMAASENDPEVVGIYIASSFVSNGAGDRTVSATIATPGTVGAGTGIIEYRLT